MLRARADLSGYPLIVLGLSTGNLTRLQERKPMIFDLKPEFGIEAAVLIMWGPTEEEIQEDITKHGLPIKLRGELLGPTGEHPFGKQRSSDAGELRMALETDTKNRKVIVNFGTSVNWIGMPAEQAIELGDMLKARGLELLMSKELEAKPE